MVLASATARFAFGHRLEAQGDVLIMGAWLLDRGRLRASADAPRRYCAIGSRDDEARLMVRGAVTARREQLEHEGS